MQMTFPALFDATDQISNESQHRFLLARGAEFVLLVISAGFGEVPRNSASDVGPWIAEAAFLLALLIRLSSVGDNAEKLWYDARAAAESIKSSAWQFAVGGGAYPLSNTEAASKFRNELTRMLGVLPNLSIPAGPGSSSAVTEEMQTLRDSGRKERAEFYLEYRVDDQRVWYSKKAKVNQTNAQRWRWFLIAVDGAAVLLGLLRIVGDFDVNWLGILAAGAAGVAAWQQIKNYSSLSEAYSVTSQEVVIVSETIAQNSADEEAWVETVRDAEAAFSREHTLWMARRTNRIG